jgi:hypothetical protein
MLPAGLRQPGVEPHVIGNADGLPRHSGTNGARGRINQRHDIGAAPDRGVAIGLEQRCRLECKPLQARA